MGIDYKAISKISKEFEQKNGKGSIILKGSKQTLDIPRISTGIEDMDEIMGGGLPIGRMIEIFGVESSGKTSLSYWLASRVERSVYIPIEGTYNDKVASSMGVVDKQMIVVRGAKYGEQALDLTLKYAKAGIPMVIIDSVPACIPKEDYLKAEKSAEIEQRIGGVARLFSKMLPVVCRTCESTGTIIVLINQIRDKMNAMPFGEQIVTPGGRAIKFNATIRMQLARRAWIEIPNKNPKVSSDNEKVGLLMKARVIKSKVCNPYGECIIPMFFDRGFESYDNYKTIRKELMNKNKVRKDIE